MVGNQVGNQLVNQGPDLKVRTLFFEMKPPEKRQDQDQDNDGAGWARRHSL
jgi:hypothetical protein